MHISGLRKYRCDPAFPVLHVYLHHFREGEPQMNVSEYAELCLFRYLPSSGSTLLIFNWGRGGGLSRGTPRRKRWIWTALLQPTRSEKSSELSSAEAEEEPNTGLAHSGHTQIEGFRLTYTHHRV